MQSKRLTSSASNFLPGDEDIIRKYKADHE